jgi:chromosomal replication initiator protein
MVNDHNIVWQNCLEIIRRSIKPQSFRTWFEPIKPIKLSGSILTLQVPNKFFYEWLEENFIDILKLALHKEIGSEARLEYQILMNNTHQVGKLSEAIPAQEADEETESITNPFVIPGIKKTKIESNLSSKYTFDNFIEGECNKLARSAGIEISNRPGITSFNPLVLYGDTSLGKTHLCFAIGNAVLEKFPNKLVLYINTDDFTNQVIYAIKNQTVNDLLNMYQQLDVLIVDDIQFLSTRPKTQEIFFNIFNQMHQAGKQVILTSDRAPKDIQDVDKRLISRFKWGLTADLGAPDYATRVSILKNKMKVDDVTLNNEIIDYICHHIKDNIRDLEGVLISLVARSTIIKKKIDLELTKEVVAQFVSHESREISIDNIKKLVADHYKVPVEKLHGVTRKRSIVLARQLSMYLAKNYTSVSLKGIGSSFGGKDHSTVIYSIRAVQDLMDTDTIFKDTVLQLEKQVQHNFH